MVHQFTVSSRQQRKWPVGPDGWGSSRSRLARARFAARNPSSLVPERNASLIVLQDWSSSSSFMRCSAVLATLSATASSVFERQPGAAIMWLTGL